MSGNHTKGTLSRRSGGRTAARGFSAGLIVLSFALGAVAADPPARPRQDAPWGEEVERELERIRTLVLPQQKEWARRLIRQRPDTPIAKAAQQLLDEYRRFDELREAERRRQEAHRRAIRAYWRARRLPPLAEPPRGVRLTNHANRAVLYQIKGPAMAWSGPYRLREGQTHSLQYPAMVRFLDGNRLVVTRVSPGTDYVFRSGTEAGALSLTAQSSP